MEIRFPCRARRTFSKTARGSIRHMCYKLESRKFIEKTDPAFKRMGKLLSDWRKERKIPFGMFVDETRLYIAPLVFNSMAESLQYARENYRQAMWANQPYYVEVWAEKLAICNIVQEITWKWRVPLLPVRGFNGLETEYAAAEKFKEVSAAGQQPIILYLGDYDKSGQCAADVSERKLQGLFGCPELLFRRLAITHEQVIEWNLPTRPSKKTSHHSPHFKGGCAVELDAVEPAQLQAVVEEGIKSLIDWRKWRALLKVERAQLKL